MVLRESMMALATPLRLPCINVMSAVSMATSVPLPMAIPTSACARAGASFTPSPTIATRRPSFWAAIIAAALSAGSTPARTCSIPTWAATASATFWLSPVSMSTSIPIDLSRAMASLAPGCTLSASERIPAREFSAATYTEVLPETANASTCLSASTVSIPSVVIKARFPTCTLTPSIRAVTPWPGMEEN